jgi:diguanylate cyclase (GGDEF)-like protein
MLQAPFGQCYLNPGVTFEITIPGCCNFYDSQEGTRGAVAIKVSLLLEQFARLAATVTGTPMAVISVIGRRSDKEPTLAEFGLAKRQLSKIIEIDGILGSGSALTVVPDLAQDQRFDVGRPGAEHLDIRFLCHLRLLSSGGERVGFICAFDQIPRPNLTEAQAESLREIANIILLDRKREQRHFHLMHVANRALRIDRVLRLVSEAESCADALTTLLQELCHSHSAQAGRIWQLVRPDSPMLEISRYDEDDRADDDGGEPQKATIELNTMIAEAIRRNEPHAIRFSELKASEGLEERVAWDLACQVCIPMWVQQQRFGISLAFDTEHLELESVVADIGSLADAIRPTLLRKVTEERIRFVAHHDNLTQLSNRLMFQQRLAGALAAARSGEHEFAVLCLDLDGFKLVNDTRGHEIGDKLLVAVALRLRDNMRNGDTVARIGGDEFAIVQPLGSQPSTATALAQRLVEAISKPFELEGRRSVIGVSIGIALYPQDGDSPDLLLRNADAALYQAKKSGRNTFRLFSAAMQVDEQEHFLVEQDLRDAIDGKHFTLEYQPICDSLSLRIVGFEALLRWNHTIRGPIQPDQFIPLAETSGLIVPLGRWALEAACAEAATWDPPVSVSVNLSPLQFRQPDLLQQIVDILDRTGLAAERLDLELTEGLLLDESDLVLRTMRGLQEQGIRITLDDFGTAYAGLSYLRRFPFDRIKIDRSFIRGICDDDSTLAIVQAILTLGGRLNLAVVAEGVETERELGVLYKLGCRLVQGYLSGKPVAGQRVGALLRQPTYADAKQSTIMVSGGLTRIAG